MHATRMMYQLSQNYRFIHLLVSIAAVYCSDIAGVYLLGTNFRFAQMRPMTLAVCVNNMVAT